MNDINQTIKAKRPLKNEQTQARANATKKKYHS